MKIGWNKELGFWIDTEEWKASHHNFLKFLRNIKLAKQISRDTRFF